MSKQWDVANPLAQEWISTRSLMLAKSINKTTTIDLQRVLSEGFERGDSIQQMSRNIEGYFNTNAKMRATRVARTEVIAASNEGALQRYEQEGIDKSEFYPSPDACFDCLSLSGEYPTMEAHGMIPVHPNCRCTFLPVVGITKPVIPEGPSGEEWFKNLAEGERNAIGDWQGTGYKDIRDAQIRGKATPEIKRAVKNMERALDKDGKYEGEVFRGLNNLDKKTFDLIGNSRTIKLDALTSGTKDANIANRFTIGKVNTKSIRFQIQSKTGVDIESVSRSMFTAEREVILRKDAVFNVVSKTEQNVTAILPDGRKIRQKVLNMVLAEV